MPDNNNRLAKLMEANRSIKEANKKFDVEAPGDDLLKKIQDLEKENKLLQDKLSSTSSNTELDKQLKKLEKDLQKANEKHESDILKQKEIYEKKIEVAIQKEKQKRDLSIAKEKEKLSAAIAKEKQKALKQIKEATIESASASDETIDKIQENFEVQKKAVIASIEAKYSKTIEDLQVELAKAKEQVSFLEQNKNTVTANQKLIDTVKRYQLKINDLELKIKDSENLIHEKRNLEQEIVRLKDNYAKPVDIGISEANIDILEKELGKLDDVISALENGESEIESFEEENEIPNEVLKEKTNEENINKVQEQPDLPLTDEELVRKFDDEFNEKDAIVEKRLQSLVERYNLEQEALVNDLRSNTTSQEKLYERIEQIDYAIANINERLTGTKDFLDEGRRSLEQERTNLNLEKDTRKEQLERLQGEERQAISSRHNRKIKTLEQEIEQVKNERKELLAFHIASLKSPQSQLRFKISDSLSTDIVLTPEERELAKRNRIQNQEEKIKFLEQNQILSRELEKLTFDKKVRKYQEIKNYFDDLNETRENLNVGLLGLKEMLKQAREEERALILSNIKIKEKEFNEVNHNCEVLQKQMERLKSVFIVRSYIEKQELIKNINEELRKLEAQK